MIKKLKYMPCGSCYVDYNDSQNFTLYSYGTKIVTVTPDRIHCTGLYSPTTRKHISLFCREYFSEINFYTIKESLEKEMDIDPVTGQFIAR